MKSMENHRKSQANLQEIIMASIETIGNHTDIGGNHNEINGKP